MSDQPRFEVNALAGLPPEVLLGILASMGQDTPELRAHAHMVQVIEALQGALEPILALTDEQFESVTRNERRLAAMDDPVAHEPAVWLLGIWDRVRAAPLDQIKEANRRFDDGSLT
jgi:hypothetical protein